MSVSGHVVMPWSCATPLGRHRPVATLPPHAPRHCAATSLVGMSGWGQRDSYGWSSWGDDRRGGSWSPQWQRHGKNDQYGRGGAKGKGWGKDLGKGDFGHDAGCSNSYGKYYGKPHGESGQHVSLSTAMDVVRRTLEERAALDRMARLFEPPAAPGAWPDEWVANAQLP